jgi:transcriptional regulator with XRE-family HTH domain
MEVLTLSIGKNIKKYRIHNGLTQKDLAKKLNITDSAITRYERGDREPNIEMINKLAAALGVSSNDLISATEDTFSLDLLSCVQRAYQNYANSFPNDLCLTRILMDDCGFSEERASEVVYSQASLIVDEIEKIISYINEIDPDTYNDFLKETDREKVIVLGKKIASQRLRNNVSVSELSILCDIESSYLERLEKGYISYLPLELKIKISKILKIALSELVDKNEFNYNTLCDLEDTFEDDSSGLKALHDLAGKNLSTKKLSSLLDNASQKYNNVDKIIMNFLNEPLIKNELNINFDYNSLSKKELHKVMQSIFLAIQLKMYEIIDNRKNI